ncbi:MAG: ferrous iron transport protein C [Chloroflexi bacterium OLB15]|nr:MAG: ferrous iron transport protein C [Chloroflexi bacterium OLB15]
MASILSQVLARFDNANEPLILAAMARDLEIDTGTLQSMIDYWVRKGELRVVSECGASCASCYGSSGCPFVMSMPLMVERVRK